MLAEIERFVNWVRRRSPAAHTWRDYRCDLQVFLEVVGDCKPGEVTFHETDRFIALQSEQGFKPATINRRLACVVALYAFLGVEDEGLICPVHRKRHHLREQQRLPRPVQEDDLKQFFAVIENARDRAMFILMLRCGLRIGEVSNLQMGDLYLGEDFPRLVVHGKGSRDRAVYLSPQAERALRAYLAERHQVSDEHVFLSYLEEGISTTSIHRRLVRYRKQCAITITAHRLRHSFANDLLNADAPITSIQKLMGHRWIESTQTYVAANDKQVCADYYAACAKIEGWVSHQGTM